MKSCVVFPDILDELDSILAAEVTGDGSHLSTNWKDRMEHRESNRVSSRQFIFDSVLSSYTLPQHSVRLMTYIVCLQISIFIEQVCCLCGAEHNHLIQCYDCGCRYCPKCDKDVHCLSKIHNRVFWTGKFFEHLPPNKVIDDNGLKSDSQGIVLTLHDFLQSYFLDVYLPMFLPIKCSYCGNKDSFITQRGSIVITFM